MGHQYTGTNTYPANFTIPDDLDDDKAATFNVAFEALGDRTTALVAMLAAYVSDDSPRIRIVSFLASGTYVPDARVVAAIAIGCGGGGGGGAGANGTTVTYRWAAGGGGGSGSILSAVPVVLVPGVTYNVDVGIGGPGGTPGGGAEGTGGGDTILRQGATALATFAGGGPGAGSRGGHVGTPYEHITPGGTPGGSNTIRIGVDSQNIRYSTTDAMWAVSAIELARPAGAGGYGCHGVTNRPATAGCKNVVGGFAGGAAGGRGADDVGGEIGGGAAGGGGAGPYGAGGAAGPLGGDAGSNDPGSNGGAGAANTGSGGGGGATAGWRGGSPQVGGNGGAGGSGRMYLILVEESP